VVLSVIALRLAMLPFMPIPEPFVHDEFSFLLGADTFASGRVTNPTPQLWPHFETFYVDMQPTYMSMYFPGPAFVMALGKVLFGLPWFGVLVCSALMCGAICRMLQGWLPPDWALFGGMLSVLRLGLFSYWTNSYYGGALPALGGALVLGALPRLVRKPRISEGLLLGTGMSILATSRPYEGFVLCAAASAVLILRYRPGRTAVRPPFKVLAAVVAVAVAGVALLGWYDFRVYGSPLTLPYTVNRARYAKVRIFGWQKPATADPVYRHEILRQFYLEEEVREFQRVQGINGFLAASLRKAGILWAFFLGLALTPALFTMHRVIRDRRVRPLVAIGGVYAAGLLANAWVFPHYAAPYSAGILALTIQSLRHLRYCGSRTGPHGQSLVRTTALACMLLAVLRLAAAPLSLRIDRFPTMWYGSPPAGLARASVLLDLTARAGSHVAIVRYAPGHSPFDDWVYNPASIDDSKVIWARDMGERENSELIRHYSARNVWLVEPDANPPRISPWR
jgi:hypothetical protein